MALAFNYIKEVTLLKNIELCNKTRRTKTIRELSPPFFYFFHFTTRLRPDCLAVYRALSAASIKSFQELKPLSWSYILTPALIVIRLQEKPVCQTRYASQLSAEMLPPRRRCPQCPFPGESPANSPRRSGRQNLCSENVF